ncbi:CocE/NonD family hydrolase [Granulicella sp. 5B5]|uniref:CocE/NonD family hydrolase n=1 Tax=Granulicella sp. 5B5 TaxID=1617967 RepID=UPI0015F60B3E|nr:CocE/NonD family hydrolase [Granulicella sp. 5B5]QMV18195.1 CocE/NonD family hydrolase [Granulicella sp. 5B5]
MRGAKIAAAVWMCVAGVMAAQTKPAQTAEQARDSRIAEMLKDYHGPEYERAEVMIPMRDGVTLHTIILRPVGSEKSGAPLPFLMTRTPYGVDGDTPTTVKLGKPELAESGYIYVEQDIRGRYESGGKFVMNRPIVAHTTKDDVDETTDTRDTIDWLLKHVPNNNGRVGVLGVSYPGFLSMMAGIDAHPAVKAISPQAPMTNIWLGDDFFHNGAFRETYGFDYVQELEAQKTDVRANSKEDQYDFFLSHVNFEGAAKAAGMTELPTAKVFLSQPSYVKFWRDMAVEPHLHEPEVPTLEVGGYWDQEDMWGTQAEYAALRPHEPADETGETTGAHKVYLVLGPWNHGGWSRGPGDELGGKFGTVMFGDEKTGAYYRTKIEAPFFEWYLKDKPGFDLKDTASFRTGENQWHRYAVWPPKQGFHEQDAYLDPAGKLGFAKPSAEKKSASYVADPANPIPYRHRPVQSTYGVGSTWRTWLVEDQRFVSDRKDLANFSTAELKSPVTVTGDVVADLKAATTGTDGDWIVKLVDVYPASEGGYQLMVAEEILRGRYRKSFTDPEPVKAGEVTEYKWSLHGVDHTFLPGHKMMVEVQSSWFPLYDRNPQTYVENIMKAPADAYKAETITIYDGSRLELPMADGVSLP